MEAPRVLLSKAAPNPIIELNSPRSRRTSSITTVNSDSERRQSSSSSQHPVAGLQQGLGSGDKRKPSVSNPYFHSSPRRVSQFNAPKFNTEITDLAGCKAKAEEANVQPSYRTEPLAERKFTPHIVKQIMDDALEEALEGMEHYEAVKCRALTTGVCEDIKQKVKFLNYDRYKLVCVVYFGSAKGQEMRVASRCLWNHNFDNFASTNVTKGDIFAVAMMYGVYKE